MSDHNTAMSRRVALSGFLGTTIEYFDFYVYGTVAALVFNQVFFNNLDPLVGTIAAFATLAAGYLSRLLGAIIFGHYGDRLGRKSALLITMIVMGLASGLIGLLPTQAQIGAAAPLLLLTLRLVQGFALGGEFGGAVLMTAEHSADNKRGRTTSLTVMGNPAGSALGMLSVLTLTGVLTTEQFQAWGWRIPFLLSFGLLIIGYFVRHKVVESPVFEKQVSTAEPTRVPVLELFRTQPRNLVLGTLILIGGVAGTGIFGVYILAYATGLGHERSTVLTAVLLGTIGSALLTPVISSFSDRVGRRPILLVGTALTAAVSFPLFWVIDQLNSALLIVSLTLYITFVMTCITAVAPVLLSELFPTHLRYTGVSMTYQLGALLGAGLMPLAASTLVANSGGNGYPVAALIVGVSVISLIAVFLTPETSGSSLTETDTQSAPSDSARTASRIA
ncbi:MHS family MFS transporter [Rhodococcus pseudokoreensis]|uniref:MHS family MFS transporter n=1 Tax=Rhodococcus pseudokoreensis TaxID=2811421 RepID=A0A974WD05_9NOCA|nr:MFS transporter [Rhodococcus pseudokoreensis]QSE88107.1 MHS family MFS transporter [Rhodococcus pseudokoreensis]QSE95273.1 MHS family MFS transporter [Rhodococcus pseudokoreensis]